MELRVKRSEIGKQTYFKDGCPHCILGHYLAAIGVAPVAAHTTIQEIARKNRLVDLTWLTNDTSTTPSWWRIVRDNDDGNPNLAIPIFAKHGINLIIEEENL